MNHEEADERLNTEPESTCSFRPTETPKVAACIWRKIAAWF
ncbi:hypothetical protein UF75_3675 [Desulfosporosinus sp. I2]|nr:hypothetical protein UF75_3675 [Desulfosporosinus sp. I2]